MRIRLLHFDHSAETGNVSGFAPEERTAQDLF